MANKFLNRLSIKNKLLLIILLNIFFILMIVFITMSFTSKRNDEIVKTLEERMVKDTDLNMKTQIETVISLIDSIHRQYEEGKYTLEEAKVLSQNIIREIRYGVDGYFWIDTTQGDNLVLYGSDIEGTNRLEFEDISGKKIIQEFIFLATVKGGGYAEYWYPKEGESVPVRKRSYVTLYKPYNWVVGTGIYTDEMEKLIKEEKTNQEKDLEYKIYIFLGAISCYIILVFLVMQKIGYNISKPLEDTIKEAKRISNGNFQQEIYPHLMTRKDEVGQLSAALDKMKNSLQTLIQDLHTKAEHLESEKEFLRTTLVAVGDGVISTDKDGKIHIINKAAERLTGWTQEEAVGKKFEKIFVVHSEETGEPFAVSVQEIFQTGEILHPEKSMVLISRNHGKTLIESQSAPIKNGKGELTGTVLVFRDITERRRKLEEIQYLSAHDQLTGLYNRRYFEDEVIKIDIQSNYPLSFIMADINGLKITNDAFGHQTGDKLIIKIAELLKGRKRPGTFISRLGGDEFVMILPKTNYEEAQIVIRKLETDMASETVDSVQVSMSLGAAEKKDLLEDSANVLKRAEEQMYKKKLIESPVARMKILMGIEKRMNEKYKNRKLYSRVIKETCERIGNAMNLPPSKLEDLKAASIYWDIGKITVVESSKPEDHLQAGYHILKSISRFAQAAEIILARHEFWDGTGFPRQLSKEYIPLESRILAVVVFYYSTVQKEKDVDAGAKKALELVKAASGTRFDPKVVAVFIENLEKTNNTLAPV